MHIAVDMCNVCLCTTIKEEEQSTFVSIHATLPGPGSLYMQKVCVVTTDCLNTRCLPFLCVHM